MNESDRIKIVSGIDIFVAIMLMIVGILVMIFAAGLLITSSISSSSPFWAIALPWTILLLGLVSTIYGIKRMLVDILKIMSEKVHYNLQQPRYPQPPQPMQRQYDNQQFVPQQPRQ